ncbi:winged helix-turn-helix domain-containing protein [Marinifilum sp. D714]|uniref:winged helix-turn-helix domain-containing protein n=1 Tax=Marinifilum sp. D714 TaxID=2937523 RepID=UPI0027CF3BB7|nr:winged helix DNA-binding domain-containing protein [Marinifilum sp. D714]MDQ2180518.1 winged helix DNA-binding domain-containing protein [Marinifilum sp. D714]
MSLIQDSLSPDQARKLVLLSQKLPPVNTKGRAIQNTLHAIEHLGYIQIDTISVVQRAHHHTLWARNPKYQASHLDQLLADKKVFEYWSHAAAYLPMRDFRFSLIRKHAIASGAQNHWYEKDEKLMKAIMKRIELEGPLMAKDFENTDKRRRDWSSKPAKRALENLFMQGDLMIPGRNNFHKIYDLTERVIPNDINTSAPTEEEYVRFLIVRYLEANGLGLASEMVYLLKNTKSLVEKYLKEMHISGELLNIKVGEMNYYALPNALDLLNKPLSRSKLKILSPFDNLLIQRKRMQAIFDFDYQIECYVPEAKRKFGYFSLPILWDGKLVARMDCKADRKTSVLHVNHLALETNLKKTDAFSEALSKELKAFMSFNDCNQIEIHRTTPDSFHFAMDKF